MITFTKLAVFLLAVVHAGSSYADLASCGRKLESETVEFIERYSRIPFPPQFGSGYLNAESYLHAKVTTEGFGAAYPRPNDVWFMNRERRSGFRFGAFRMTGVDAEQRLSLLFLDCLRRGALKNLHPGEAGVSFHIQCLDRKPQVYTAMDLSRIHAPDVRSQMPSQWRRLPETYWEFLKRQYVERLKIPPADVDRLIDISKTMHDRTILLTKTRESLVLFHPTTHSVYSPDQFPIAEPELRRLKSQGFDAVISEFKETLEVTRGGTLVTSRSSDEPLPLEELLGIRVQRKPGEKIAEIGRMAASKTQELGTTPREAQQFAAIAQGVGVDRLVIIADATHQRLFRRYGFQVVSDGHVFDGENYAILEVPTHELLKTVIRDEFPQDQFDLMTSGLIKKYDLETQQILQEFQTVRPRQD